MRGEATDSTYPYERTCAFRERWLGDVRSGRSRTRVLLRGHTYMVPEAVTATATRTRCAGCIHPRPRPRGLVAKRLNSRYEPGQRSSAWQKMRINRGQEFVIGGYTTAAATFDGLIFGTSTATGSCTLAEPGAGLRRHPARSSGDCSAAWKWLSARS